MAWLLGGKNMGDNLGSNHFDHEPRLMAGITMQYSK